MKKIILFLILLTSLFSRVSNISKAVAIGIFDKNGYGENIQHLKKTKNDYNGICYSKIVVFGKLEQSIPKVKIGDSIGHQINSIPIYNKRKILIGREITFKHYTVTKGYFKVTIDNKLFDMKVFVK